MILPLLSVEEMQKAVMHLPNETPHTIGRQVEVAVHSKLRDWASVREAARPDSHAAWMNERFKVVSALAILERFGNVDGSHHKDWAIDQVVRALTADKYDEWVAVAKAGADGPNTYGWSEGVPP